MADEYHEFRGMTEDEAERYTIEQGNGSVDSRGQRVRGYIAAEIMAQDPGLVCDLCCGPGLDAFRYPASLYTGIDFSEVLLKVARRRNPAHTFVLADARELPLPDQHFDFVIVKSVLESLATEADSLAVFREAIRVCKRRAYFAWHTPPTERPESQIDRVKAHFGHDTAFGHLAIAPFRALATWNESRVDNFYVWRVER